MLYLRCFFQYYTKIYTIPTSLELLYVSHFDCGFKVNKNYSKTVIYMVHNNQYDFNWITVENNIIYYVE